MKKNILLAVLVIACVIVALPAFAANPTTIDTGNTTQIGGANFVPSTNVVLSAWSGPTNAATSYSVSSVHTSSLAQTSGRAWASYTGGASAIYYKNNPADLASVAATAPDTLPGGNTGWQAQ